MNNCTLRHCNFGIYLKMHIYWFLFFLNSKVQNIFVLPFFLLHDIGVDSTHHYVSLLHIVLFGGSIEHELSRLWLFRFSQISLYFIQVFITSWAINVLFLVQWAIFQFFYSFNLLFTHKFRNCFLESEMDWKNYLKCFHYLWIPRQNCQTKREKTEMGVGKGKYPFLWVTFLVDGQCQVWVSPGQTVELQIQKRSESGIRIGYRRYRKDQNQVSQGNKILTASIYLNILAAHWINGWH